MNQILKKRLEISEGQPKIKGFGHGQFEYKFIYPVFMLIFYPVLSSIGVYNRMLF